jgi:phage terminase large subunit-like protein
VSTLQLPDDWRELDDDSKRVLVEQLTRVREAQQRALWHPYPWQRPHVHAHSDKRVCDSRCRNLHQLSLSPHELWLLLGGRGTGKTDGAARYVADHVRGPACDDRLPGGHRIAIIAPTLGDAVESCVNGPSGLATHYPGCKVWSSTGGTFVRFPNGSLAKVFGAHTPDDVERLRAGGNRCLAWWEELAAWRQLEPAMEHSRYGLRLGSATIIASTTPKPRKAIIELVKDDRVHMTRGRTQDAHHLDELVRDELLRKYAGTRSGRQELDGELLQDIEGALWTYDTIEAARVRSYDAGALIADLARIVVAIDPAATNTEDSDETGIVVTGRSRRDSCPVCGPVDEPHGFVLDDRSGRYPSDGARGWGQVAVDVFEQYDADLIVAEVNNGGDMVGAVVRSRRRNVPYREVRATRGKRLRAEPVAALYTARPLPRVHHVGAFPILEDQQTTWTPDDADSPDRMDALVWGLTELLVKRASGHASVA